MNTNYDSFRAQYEKQHPASVPVLERDVHEYPVWLQPVALVMFIAVSIVSGAHTTSTVRQTLEASLIANYLKDGIAFASFFGFELALFVSVFSWLRSNARWVSYASTIVVFMVIVLANVRDVGRSIGSDDWFTSVIVIGIGFGTPLVALLSGKLFVDVYRSNRGSSQRAREAYREALKQWDATILRAWNVSQKEIEKRENSQNFMNIHEISGTQEPIHEISRTTPDEYKPRVKLHNIAKQVRENGDEHLSVNELMQKYDISQGSTTKVREILRSSNGHLN